jgi:hypothetical protein
MSEAPTPQPEAPPSHTKITQHEATPPRKRPTTATTDKRLREASPAPVPATATKPLPERMSQAELLMMQKMQNFALEVAPPPPKPLKRQPKPPPTRYAERHPESVPKVEVPEPDIIDENTDDEWVYETYVRHVDPIPAVDLSASQLDIAMSDPLSGIASGGKSFGILVIDDEDEERWKAFGDDEGSSDESVASDDEDENAEDYYGNDYPEDELQSDDEYDRGAYTYRKGASDDEEWDATGDGDAGIWSDDDEGTGVPEWRKGWSKKQQSMIAGGGRSDSDSD